MKSFEFENYTLTFDEFQAAVDTIQMGTTASELHGYQSGLVCVLTQFDDQLWWEVLQADYPSTEDKEADAEDLNRINISLKQTIQTLEDSDCNFQLMLPDDDDSLIARVAALSDWCAGFFTGMQRGLTLAKENIVNALRENATILELLQDLEAIRQAEALELSTAEDFIETERNYAEICEYVRVAVMNIYLEVCANELDVEMNDASDMTAIENTHLH